ncbi:c-24(28) sterol reductase [Aspergillus bombycis]|uniref:C-24(28) sterol reductase n=1 Tax=Aspergillus bombycis TaxID=109264 RepID=A0A1F7ZJJ5_9EURO|nr:c-24(28) sterol reductase [Aspergillus bombycis]OGM39627.1 c-24(28) sterol reductase [Aspergillus bombycis]
MERPGFIETPGRRVTRSSAVASEPNTDDTSDSAVDMMRGPKSATRRRTSGKTKAEDLSEEEAKTIATNGHAISTEKKPRIVDGWEEGKDPKVDFSGHFEFGGSWGVLSMMIGFPMLMYYMWIGAVYYDGKFPRASEGQSTLAFIMHLANLVYVGAFPSVKAWAIYWMFFLFEGACYLLLPGITVMGRPLPHLGGKQLPYYCSAVWSFYTSILLALALHFTGIFKLYTIIDEFGPLMSVAILSGFLVSFVAYFSALARGAQHRMTGYPIYDFFMGAELNPRMFGILDFKMFFEVRLPWYILLFVTMGAAARQYEVYGYVSGEVGFLLMAHFLYANACSKGEECIVSTWDMYYEKWGFMLIFWNLAGVPLSYCHCTIYLANHDPATYHWNRYFLTILYIAYLFVYWVWDTTNSQKNRYRQQERGTMVFRNTFPQLPWQTLENPKTITAEDGSKILVDGWYGKARIYVFHPTIPGYPKARFPGVVVFSEIYQVTGPVSRFARQIAGQGYICAAPSSYHEFTGPEPLEYNVEDTDKGNKWKVSKKLAAYDEDASLCVDYLLSLPTCNGRVGATDIHSKTLAAGKNDDSLARAEDIKGELIMASLSRPTGNYFSRIIFGKNDNHVPPEGRDLIRKTLHDKGVLFSFYEVAWAQHAFIRDELSKGRYDPAITKVCFEMLLELFGRTLKMDLGEHDGKELEIEDVC